MTGTNIVVSATVGATLQDQIRRQIVDAAVTGAFPSDRPIPSTRALSLQLGVSRNTVVQAYQRLVADGFLISRPRSGLFVDESVVRGADPKTSLIARTPKDPGKGPDWATRMKVETKASSHIRTNPNWLQYPYPFIDGLFDPSLFPVSEWRETDRLALSLTHTQAWSAEAGDADDPQFIAEIRSKLLLRRGIHARPDEILVTMGGQHARYLTARLLMDRTTVVALEEPGLPEMLDLTRAQGSQIVFQPIDDDGMVDDERLEPCRVIYVTPSQQPPTGATLSLARRHAILARAAANDAIVIEDDTASEMIAGEAFLPALHSLDPDDRVIYLGSLARVLSPGLQLGYIVGPAEFIAEARRLRRRTVRHPPRMNQRAAALFMSNGHYDATLVRLRRIMRERRSALFDALNHYLPRWVSIERASGGTSYWVVGPDDLDAGALAQEAELHGVLIEPVDGYYGKATAPKNVIRMSATGLPASRIRPGVEVLASLIRASAALTAAPVWSIANRLSGSRLIAALSDVTILHKTVYGEPFSIQLRADGSMSGRLGYANEDDDVGRWSVDGDLWSRQWTHWAYGESLSFYVVIEGDRIGWLNAEGRLLDTAILVRP